MAPPQKTKVQQKKQLSQKVSEKQQQQEKKAQKKVSIQQQKKQENKSKVETKSILAESSKKIKKTVVQPKKVEKKSQKLNPIIDNYSEFALQESAKYEKIKKNTMNLINLDKELIKTASKALLKYHTEQKKSNDMLESNDDFIYLEIAFDKIPEKYSIRPIQIPLPVPMYTEENNSRFCIFSKDPQREYKDKIQDLEIPLIAKVQGVSKIDKKFPTFKAKQTLMSSYEQFFCDYKIYNLLRKPLGKAFYERKKIPYPIDCEKVPEHLKSKFGDDYQAYLNDLQNYTYFQMGNGPAYTVKVGRESMEIKDLVKNIIHGVYNTIPHILKQKIENANVKSISIKTFNSVSFPIYNQLNQKELQAFSQKKPQAQKAKQQEKQEVQKVENTKKPAQNNNSAQKIQNKKIQKKNKK